MNNPDFSSKKIWRYLPFVFGLIAIGLVFKSCDAGKTEETKRTTNANSGSTVGEDAADPGESSSDDEVDGQTDTTDGSVDQTSGDTTVYTLNVEMEQYADTDVSAFRFYIDSKDGSKQTFLKEVAVAAGFDFSQPKFTFVSSELSSISDFVDTETCLTVKAVRSGLESDESTDLCFTEW